MNVEPCAKAIVDEVWPFPVTATSDYLAKEAEVNRVDKLLKRQIRNESIVRNPCLPQRFKKGSKQ